MKQTKPEKLGESTLHRLRGDSPTERLLHRLHAVALVLHGLSASEVARAFGDSPRAVAYWAKRFLEQGMEGLHEEARSGRPPKLNPTQMKHLQGFLEQSAAGSKAAQARALSGFIKARFQIEMSVFQCARILARLKP